MPLISNNPKGGDAPRAIQSETAAIIAPAGGDHGSERNDRCTPLAPLFSPDAILAIIGLAGAAFNAAGSPWGFVIWIPGNIGLVVINQRRGYRWQAALFAAYTVTAAWGIYQWICK